MVAESGEIRVAVGFGEGGHFRGDAIDLFQADLVDLGGREGGCGEAAQSRLVAAFAAAEGIDGERGSGVGDVVRGNEGRELLVSGKDLVVDGGGDLFGETLLFGVGEAGGELLERKEEGVGGDHALSLAGNLFGDESDGDEVIVHSGAEDFLGLEEGARDLVEARDVVLVVLDGIEWHGKREVGEVDMDATAAAGCAEGHLELFEVVVLRRALEAGGGKGRGRSGPARGSRKNRWP